MSVASDRIHFTDLVFTGRTACGVASDAITFSRDEVTCPQCKRAHAWKSFTHNVQPSDLAPMHDSEQFLMDQRDAVFWNNMPLKRGEGAAVVAEGWRLIEELKRREP